MKNSIAELKLALKSLIQNKTTHKKGIYGFSWNALSNINCVAGASLFMLFPLAGTLISGSVALMFIILALIFLYLSHHIDKKYALAEIDFFKEIDSRIAYLIKNIKEEFQKDIIDISKDFLLLDKNNTLKSELLVIHEKLNFIEYINKKLSNAKENSHTPENISLTLNEIENNKLDILNDIDINLSKNGKNSQ